MDQTFGADPRAQFHLLKQTYEHALGDSPGAAAPRRLVSESWQRSLAAHVDPDAYQPPVVYTSDEVSDARSTHPLHEVLPVLRGMLVDIAEAAEHLMIVTDADGVILWREGTAGLRLRADPVGLCEGTRWTEDAIGTNAMGTALAVDAPVQIYSAEHLVRTYHTWTCAAAPIHDPDTGRVLGSVDISGHLYALHPAVVKLVTATAQLAEGQLRAQLAVRDERMRDRNMRHLLGLGGTDGALLTTSGRVLAAQPHGHWPERLVLCPGQDRLVLDDGREAVLEPLAEGYLVRIPRIERRAVRRPMLSLAFLRERPAAVLDGTPLPLTLRRAELLTLLAAHPAGLTAEQLAFQLYGDAGNPTTVRAEVHRLRSQLGEAVIRTKPYRLSAELDADFLAARAALRGGAVRRALDLCQAPLLARSEVPAIRAERDHLAMLLRGAVLDQWDLEVLWQYAQREPGCDDLEVFERLTRELSPHDARLPVAKARLKRLLAEES